MVDWDQRLWSFYYLMVNRGKQENSEEEKKVFQSIEETWNNSITELKEEGFSRRRLWHSVQVLRKTERCLWHIC